MKMRRVALVTPKSTFLELPMVMMPLGLPYLAARLESLGHYTVYFDLNVDEFPEDVYDEIWVSATSAQLKEVKRIGQILKNYDAKGVLGGSAIWADKLGCTEIEGYDLYVAGEADSPKGMQDILSADRDMFINIPVSNNLDWVLPPTRRWARKYSSALADGERRYVPATTMFTTRGCPFECAFCESGRRGVIWGDKTRYEPLDVVEYQIAECEEMGFGALLYYDDILPLHKLRTLEIMKLHRKYDMIWRGFIRSDVIHRHGGYDYLKELRDGGLVECFVGVESANNVIKANIHKGTTIEQDTDIINWCRDLHIRCKASFVLGLPGETKASMDETRRWILEVKPDRVQVGRLIPFSGTPLTKHPEQYDLKIEREIDDGYFYMGKNSLHRSFVSTSHLSVEEIDEFWHKLNDELEELGVSK